MSYEKPIRQCQDAGVGFQEINKLVTNQGNVSDALEFEHEPELSPLPNATGLGDTSGGGASLVATRLHGGYHDTPKVARGTLHVVVQDPFAIGSSALTIASKSGCCVGLVRLDTGSYFVPVQGLVDFYARVTPASVDATPTYLVQQTPAIGAVSPGVYISLWNYETIPRDDGGTPHIGFALADFAFDVTIYGRRSESNEAALTPSKSMRKVSLNPRNHMRPFKFLRLKRR